MACARQILCMIFESTAVNGVFIIRMEKRVDERGFFARAWCRREFSERGLNTSIEQCNVSFNRHRGTLRGLHYQVAPYQEAKLVRCTRGSIHDVVVDLRRESPSFLKHVAVQLDAESHTMVYVPEGCAHGFQTLDADSEVFYQMSCEYAPECSRGVRWNDPAFGIEWPIAKPIILERDACYGDFETGS